MYKAWRAALMGASVGIIVAAAACPVLAADKLAVTPPPFWVVPVATPTDDGKGDGAPVKVLLRDEQVDLSPGKITRYSEGIIKVQTPQGLSAGAVSFTWNPDSQSATVHKLQIRRGAQIIDVLASGQNFTVMRRETNLENAVLDGQLTASIQPEGLQVGDIIDFSVSIITSDPAVGNHVEQIGAMWNGVPIARAHLRTQWPSSVPMRLQANGGLALPKVVRRNGLSSIELSMDNIQPLVLPKGAPPRYQYGRLIEMTDLASWDGIVALMAPLYAKAEQLPADGAVQKEIAKIRAASPDPKARAEAALALVQDRIRYVFLGMNDGGLVPADAEATWSRRFGDCKGKTVLLLAMLHALGIEAHPVLVSSALGDGLEKRLPVIALFDHVLVRATIGGRTYWLDGTRVGDRSLEGIETPNWRWGLPLVPGSTALVAMVPPPYDKPQTDVSILIDATGGLTPPAPIHIERTVRGDEAIATNLALANAVGDVRDRALRQFWKQNYDFAEPKTVTSSFDPIKREFKLVMDGTTKMDWNEGWYEADHVWVGYKADFGRDPGPDKNAPYAIAYPRYTHVTETILLPAGRGTFTITPGSDVDQTVAGSEYHRRARIEGNRFIVETSDRSLAPEFPAAEAPAAQEMLRTLAKKSVFLNRPSYYLGTQADIAARLTGMPTTTAGMLDQALVLIHTRRYDQAVERFTKVIAREPKNVSALAGRGIARTYAGDTAGGTADLDAAQALAPRDAVVLRARGLVAQHAGHFQEGIDLLTAALDIAPGDLFTLAHRAEAYYAVGQYDRAFADTTTILARDPSQAQLYLLRANILRGKGDTKGVAEQADALVATNPKDVLSLVTAGRIYAAVDRQDKAMAAFTAAIAIKPEAYIYINRFHVRPPLDVAGRQADLDAAIKLDPKSPEVPELNAVILGLRHDWRGVVAILTDLIASRPADISLLTKRGVAYAKMGDQVLADKDFAVIRAAAKTAPAMNHLCWVKASEGVALDSALADCDAALALSPDNSLIQDSRALVLLRLGRIDEAVALYDKVLAKIPALSSSLYGRAVAKASKGDMEGSARDVGAALNYNPHVREEFEGYGLSVQGEAAKAAKPGA